MARPKKPTNLKVLEGNPGKRDLPKNEVKPKPVANKCPNWMSDEAKEIWAEYAPKLERLGLFTEVDGMDFQNLCIAAADVRRHTETLMSGEYTFTTPQGYISPVPEVGMRNKAITMVTTLSAKFGMSPSDRAGLVIPEPEKDKSKMGGLLSGG